VKACIDPSGHDWFELAAETIAGSTAVFCTICGENGFRLRTAVIDNQGLPGEELF